MSGNAGGVAGVLVGTQDACYMKQTNKKGQLLSTYIHVYTVLSSLQIIYKYIHYEQTLCILFSYMTYKVKPTHLIYKLNIQTHVGCSHRDKRT